MSPHLLSFPLPHLKFHHACFQLRLGDDEFPSLLSCTDSGSGGCFLSAGQYGLSSSTLVLSLATVADFLIVYLRNKCTLLKQAIK